MTPVNPEHLRNEIQLLRAKVELAEREQFWLQKRSASQRALYRWMAQLSSPAGASTKPLDDFCAASKEYDKAQADKRGIEISEMKSRLAICEAILKEAENGPPVAPGQSGLIVSN